MTPQPISTAPLDKTVLIIDAEAEEPVWFAAKRLGNVWDLLGLDHDSFAYYMVSPTHWCEYPSIPAAQEKNID